MHLKKANKKRFIAFDTQLIVENKSLYRFFDDEELDDPIVNNKLEKDLLRFLFHSAYKLFNYLIFEELAIKDHHYFLEVREPIVTNSKDKPGDIDLLLVSKNDPSISIAFQMKKIKGFIEYKSGEKNINVKTSGISEAVIRANKMFRNFRFHQNYLMLIVANDGQSFDWEFSSRQIEPVYNLHSYQSLNNDVGIFIIEITLEEAVSGASRGMISSKLFKKPSLVPQSFETTKKIQLLINDKKKPASSEAG